MNENGYGDGTATYWRGKDGQFNATAGENNRGAKLTEEQVRDIKSRPKSQTHQSVADEFGLSRAYVSNIRNGRRWSHVK